MYDDVGSTWYKTGPGTNSATFRLLQDTTVSGFGSSTNTLLAASDGDQRAYLSYDYSPRAFTKYDQITGNFSTLGSRPSGDQFAMGVY